MLGDRLKIFLSRESSENERKLYGEIAKHHDTLHRLHIQLGNHEQATHHRKVAKFYNTMARGEETTAKFNMRPTPKAKRGMFDGWSMEKLRNELIKIRKQMKQYKGKVPAALRSHFAQVMFAIRAKQGTHARKGKHWGKITAQDDEI
jgi:hypothetical protein